MAQLSEKKLAGAKLHFDKCHKCTVDACPQNHVCVYQRSGVSVFPKLLTYISDTHNHRLLLIPILNCVCFVLIPCTAQLFRRFTMWVTQCQIYGYTQHSATYSTLPLHIYVIIAATATGFYAVMINRSSSYFWNLTTEILYTNNVKQENLCRAWMITWNVQCKFWNVFC